MSDIDDLKRRMAAVEATVAEQSRLRAAVDSDQADMKETLRAQHLLVQALAITQGQHTRQLEAITQKLTRLETAVAVVSRGQEQIVGLLNQLIERES